MAAMLLLNIDKTLIPMEYIFIHAEKDVITDKNDRMKNWKEKRKLSVKKLRSGEVLMNLFIY